MSFKSNSMGVKRRIIDGVLRRMGYVRANSIAADADADICFDQEFLNIYLQCKDYTMVSIQKSFALYNAVRYIVQNKIPGDFVECGVWKGGQAMLISLTLQKEREGGRKLYLYDTYTGMTEPGLVDVHIKDKEKAHHRWEAEEQLDHNEWCYASLDEVQKNVISTGYPVEQLVFIKGKVEETIPATIPQNIALLRLDTDWYASTYHELQHLYPRLAEGGVLIIDDYGTWEGSRKATEQYIEEQNLASLFVKIGKSGRIALKRS